MQLFLHVLLFIPLVSPPSCDPPYPLLCLPEWLEMSRLGHLEGQALQPWVGLGGQAFLGIGYCPGQLGGINPDHHWARYGTA